MVRCRPTAYETDPSLIYLGTNERVELPLFVGVRRPQTIFILLLFFFLVVIVVDIGVVFFVGHGTSAGPGGSHDADVLSTV